MALKLSNEDVERALLVLGGVVEASEFQAWQSSFVRSHMASFDFGTEENRLEHTEIHQLYERGLESHLAAKLPAGVDMAALEEALLQPEVIHGLSDAAGQVLQVLLLATDFMAFKDMMLFEKAKYDGDNHAQVDERVALIHETGASVVNVEEVLETCCQLSLAAASDGWSTVLENSWLRIDMKPVDSDKPAEIFLRGVWTMELSFLECCDMMMNFSSNRSGWDKNFRGCDVLKGGSLASDDIVVRSHIDFGFLLHAAGFPRSLTSRIVRKWGYPEANSVAFVMIPWNAEMDSFDADNAILTQKVTTIKPHPENEAKSVMTTIESNKLGRLPRWVLGTLMNVTAPQLMKGLEQRYIATARACGTTEDWLPVGFVGPRYYPPHSSHTASSTPSCWAGLRGQPS